MSAHCGHHHDELGHARHVLWIAFFLNFPLFLLELWQGIRVDSTSLIADSMDFLSDASSYLITLFVLAKPLHMRAKASIFKACLMLLLAVGALSQGIHNILHSTVPEPFVMGWVGLCALAANVMTALLLFKTRGKDSNMRSIWLCSRNDALNNIFVILAAGLVYATGSLWPDIAVALIIAGISATSAVSILRQARGELAGA